MILLFKLDFLFFVDFFLVLGGGGNGSHQCQLLMAPFVRNIIESCSPNRSQKPPKCLLPIVRHFLCSVD